MAISKRLLGPKDGTDVRLKIDLEELFDDPADRPAARQAFAQDVIDAIVERAESGKSATGGALKSPYSKEYAESVDFIAFGKSRGDVNMTLTGSMLAAIDVRDDTQEEIEIGWDKGSEDGKKAHGNITGRNGQVATKRDFFGLPESEIRAIAKRYEEDFAADRATELNTVGDILNAINSGFEFFPTGGADDGEG